MKQILVFIRKNKMFSIFCGLAVILILIAVFAPLIAPMSPYDSELKDAFIAPGKEHFFGTDKLGRDVFSRVIYGSRISISAALTLVAAMLIIGAALGIIAGFYGGIIDAVIMRLSDMMISFPGMVLAIAVAGIMGASVTNAMIALLVIGWPKYARLARSLVLKIRHNDYIYAAQVLGTRNRIILVRHLLPNIIPTLVVTAATDIGTMMLELAGLSFLGFGAQAPAAEWGLMLNEGRQYMLDCPWLMLFPGLAVCIVVIVFNLLGDSLWDILDPKHE